MSVYALSTEKATGAFEARFVKEMTETFGAIKCT